MATTYQYTLEACLQNATERQTAYAASVLHLFQSSLTPTTSTTKAEFTAAEATFDDYVTKALATWFAPILAPLSGYQIVSPLVQWACAADQVTPNDIGGAWMEDAATKVRMMAVFDTILPMAFAGNGIDLFMVDFFPTG